MQNDNGAVTPHPAPNQQRYFRFWPLAFLGGVAVLFFWSYFLLDMTLYGGDTAFVFLPFRHYVLARLGQGEMPLWNPHIFGGTPALAEAQYQVFYWPNALLLLLGVPRGMGWTLPLHLILMSVGTYVFGRCSLKLDRPAATVMALAFAFGGCVQSRLAVSVYTQAAAWLPWLLLAYDYAIQRGSFALWLPGLILATQLCTGAPQYTYYSLTILLAYHLYCGPMRRRAALLKTAVGAPVGAEKMDDALSKRAWLVLGVTFIGGAFWAAAQVLPELELARLSDRGTHATYDFVTQYSLVPRHFFTTMLFPKFWGLFNTTPLDGFYPGEETGYLGALTLGLVGAALVAGRSRRETNFWLCLGVVSVGLAFGRHNPCYPTLYQWVPGIAMFRAPARWLLVTSFSGAVLAGIGTQAIFQANRRGVLAARGGFMAALSLLALGVAWLLSPWGQPAFKTPQAPYGAWGQVVMLALATLLLGLAGWGPGVTLRSAPDKWPRFRRALGTGMLMLLALDLGAVAQDMEMQHTLAVAAVEAPPQTVKALQADPLRERFWAWNDEVPLEAWQMPSTAGSVSSTDFRAHSTVALRSLMPSCVPTEFGTWGLTGAWGALMPLRRNPRPIYHADTPTEVRRQWLRLLNVRHYLSLRPLHQPDLQLQTGTPLYIYRDPAPLPRAFFTAGVHPAHGDEAVAVISGPTFDPRREVVLEHDTNGTAPQPSPAQLASRFTPAHIAQYDPEHILVKVDAPTAGHLVVMDTFYPGWHALVDGQPAALQPANWVGRSIAVPAGQHTIEMWFDPATLRFGLFITLLTLSGFMASVLMARAYASGQRKERVTMLSDAPCRNAL